MDKIVLERVSNRSNRLVFLYFAMITPLFFVFLKEGDFQMFFITLGSSLFLFYLILKSFSKSDSLKIIFDTDGIKFQKVHLFNNKEEWIELPKENVTRVSTYSPLMGGTGIKIWESDSKCHKIRTIGNGDGGRFVRFTVTNGPSDLREDTIRDSLDDTNKQFNSHCSIFTERLLGYIKDLGYSAEY